MCRWLHLDVHRSVCPWGGKRGFLDGDGCCKRPLSGSRCLNGDFSMVRFLGAKGIIA